MQAVTAARGAARPAQALADLALERDALAACILHGADPRKLCEADFYSGANGLVWRALCDLVELGRAMDTVQLRTRLSEQGMLARVGGDEYLLSLTDTVPPRDVPVERLGELRCLRDLASASSLVAHKAQTGAPDLAAALLLLERAEQQLAQHRAPKGPAVPDLADYVETMRFDGRRFPTGFDTLDEALGGGLPLGVVVTLVGAPGAAKTTLATWLGDTLERAGCAVAFVAADERRDGIVVRLGQLEGFARDGLESPHSTLRRALAVRLRARPRLCIVDPFRDGARTLEAAAEHLDARAGDAPRVLIVDSVQKVPCRAAEHTDTERARIGAVMQQLERIADTGTLVIAISEMSRAGYRTTERAQETTLSAAAESRAIEYSSSLLVGVRAVQGEPGVVHLDVAKNRVRSGKPELRVRLDFETARFRELEACVVQTPEEKADKRQAERMHAAKERVRATLRQHRTCTSRRDVLALVDGTAAHNLAALNRMLHDREVVLVDGCLRLEVRT